MTITTAEPVLSELTSISRAECFEAGRIAERGEQASAGWQRRVLYPSVPGAIPQWEMCDQNEANDLWLRSPGHEYREIFAAAIRARSDTHD